MGQPDTKMTIEEAAELLHITPRAVHRWQKLGRLQIYRNPQADAQGKPRPPFLKRSEVLAAAEKQLTGDFEGSQAPEHDPSMG